MTRRDSPTALNGGAKPPPMARHRGDHPRRAYSSEVLAADRKVGLDLLPVIDDDGHRLHDTAVGPLAGQRPIPGASGIYSLPPDGWTWFD